MHSIDTKLPTRLVFQLFRAQFTDGKLVDDFLLEKKHFFVMSQDASTTPESAEDATVETTPTADPPPPPPLDPIAVFMEAYDCAKNNYHWPKVNSAVSDHPEWLIQIPPGLLTKLSDRLE